MFVYPQKCRVASRERVKWPPGVAFHCQGLLHECMCFQKVFIGYIFTGLKATLLYVAIKQINLRIGFWGYKKNHSPEIANNENSHCQRTEGDGVANCVHYIEAFKKLPLEENNRNTFTFLFYFLL